MTDSRGGGAILSAQGLTPGRSATGAVTLANSGDTAATVSLSQADLIDSPVIGGARLSAALEMTVEDATTGVRLYSGQLKAMPDLPLGTFRTGESREYRFTASLPANLPAELMRATASVRYDWTATAVEPPPVDPPAAGGGSGGTTPPPVGTAPPPAPPPPAGTPFTLNVTNTPSQKWKKPIVVSATCNAACTLATTAKLGGVKQAPKLSVPAARGAANGPVAIKVQLSGKAKAALTKIMRNKRAKASLTFTVTATAGSQTAQRVVTVKLVR